MPMTIHVNGEAKIQVNTGSAHALQDLGVSVDGVEIDLRPQYDEIMTDTFGPKVPFELQYFLEDAIIRAELVFYDQIVLNTIISPLIGGTPGIQGQAGSLVMAGGFSHQVSILSPGVTGELPWSFPNAILIDQQQVKIGTKRQTYTLTWRALPYTGSAGSTSTAQLYRRSIP